MKLWTYFIENIASDGFIGNRDEYYRIKEMLRPIVFLTEVVAAQVRYFNAE